MTAPIAGRHRPTTVPSYWDRPGERRHLAGTPGFDWFTAATPELGPYALPAPPVPAFPPPGEAPTPELDPDDTREIPLIPLLPPLLEGPDPEPTGPIPCWATGPQPILPPPPPRDDKPPSMAWGWIAALYLAAAVAYVMFAISLGAT